MVQMIWRIEGDYGIAFRAYKLSWQAYRGYLLETLISLDILLRKLVVMGLIYLQSLNFNIVLSRLMLMISLLKGSF